MIEFLASDICTRTMGNLFLVLMFLSLFFTITVYLLAVIKDISGR